MHCLIIFALFICSIGAHLMCTTLLKSAVLMLFYSSDGTKFQKVCNLLLKAPVHLCSHALVCWFNIPITIYTSTGLIPFGKNFGLITAKKYCGQKCIKLHMILCIELRYQGVDDKVPFNHN